MAQYNLQKLTQNEIKVLYVLLIRLIRRKRLVSLTAFLPRCMECQRELATRKLSVRPSVYPSVKRVICDKRKIV